MKLLYPIILSAFLFLAQAFSTVNASEAWEEKIQAESGQYVVKVQPKRVEVARIEAGPGAPPHMRMRILRKNNRPLEVRLHTINRPESPVKYTGGIDRWNDSYLGFELEFSFDRKTWKKLGERMKRALP